jgi:MFS family permease
LLVSELKESEKEGIMDRKRWENRMRKQIENLKEGVIVNVLLSLPSELKVLLMSRTLRRCLFLALTLVFLQQFSGQGAILIYSGVIFGQLCPHSTSDCIIGFGIVKLFFVLVMVFVADSYARRTFLVMGSSIMTISLALLCIGLAFHKNALALVGIYVSVAASESSLATLLFVVLSEIFPQFVRSAAISVVVATFFAWSAIVIFVLPIMNTNYGLVPVFIMYTVIAAFSVILLYFLVPETRGIDLEIAYKLVNGRMENTLKICSSEISGEEEEVGLLSAKDTDDDASHGIFNDEALI